MKFQTQLAQQHVIAHPLIPDLHKSITITMQIHIKRLDGQKEELSVSGSDTVTQLIEQLSEKIGVNKDQIRLISKGKPMLMDRSLNEQGVIAGGMIHMIMQLRGGSGFLS